MKKIWIGISIIVVVALSILLAVTHFKKEPNVIKIGIITTLTGQSAKYGESVYNGILIAIEEINANGGINGKQIKLIIEDDGSETNRAVFAFRKLANIDHVLVIIGPISSSAAMACSPLANKLKVVLFSPSAATPDFTSLKDYTFRNRISAEFEITELAKVAYLKLNMREVAILYVNNEYGLGNKKYFEKAFQDVGGKIVIIEAFDEGTTDLRTQLTKIKQEKLDGIFVVGQGSEGGYALRQASELGIKIQFLSTITVQRADVLRIAGKAANGVIFSVPLYDPQVSKRAEEFEMKYLQRFSQGSDMFSGNGYDSIYIIAKAIEEGGYNADGIRNALFDIKNFPGVTGETSFDMNGDVIKPVTIKKIENGQFVDFY